MCERPVAIGGTVAQGRGGEVEQPKNIALVRVLGTWHMTLIISRQIKTGWLSNSMLYLVMCCMHGNLSMQQSSYTSGVLAGGQKNEGYLGMFQQHSLFQCKLGQLLQTSGHRFP